MKNLKRLATAVVTVGVFSWLMNGCLSAPPYEGPKSDHFDGQRFFNKGPRSDRGFFDLIKWQLTRKQKKWPEWVDIVADELPPKRLQSGFRVTFINHATVLVQLPEANILTDPVWSDRVAPFSFAGPKRHKNPGIKFEDLPPIDIVLISHNHYDHLDAPTLQRLNEEHTPQFIAGLGTRELLKGYGIEGAIDLDWWEQTEARGMQVHFTPVQHWSARGLSDRNMNLWGGFFLQAKGRSIYFAGDTGISGGHFAEVKERIGAPDVALLPIGAYEPRWFMKVQHMNPAEAVQAHLDLGAKRSVGVHWGTFQLTDEAMGDPPAALAKALTQAGLSKRVFMVLENGAFIDDL